MNLPNKITIARIVMAIMIVIVLLFPFHSIGIPTLKLFVNESLVVDVRHLIAGFLFLIASLTDALDGYIARKNNLVTDYGKVLDAIADKILVNSVLIILASQGMISQIIPVIVIARDAIVNAIKMIAGEKDGAVAAIKSGKIKTILMTVGITMVLFYNLPFELLNFAVADIVLIIATILSVTSGVEYYNRYKKFFKK